MAKMTFRYGAVSSAKTLNLLAVAHQVGRPGQRVVVMKPALDTRDGPRTAAGRAGLADDYRGAACILVDEAQFLSAHVVEQLRELTRSAGVTVFAYGLRTDFRGRLFEGSRRLLELADSIEEVKTSCALCDRKAVFNQRLLAGRPVTEGPAVQLGGDESYRGVCYDHLGSGT